MSHFPNVDSSKLEESGHLSFDHGAASKTYPLEGLSDFTLKSEYLEKDIVIDEEVMKAYQSTVDEGDITTIKVFKESGIEEVGAESLKNYIEKNKDIKKVVIEKVSLEEASRVSLLFEPDQKKKSLKIVPTNGDYSRNTINISSIEDEVNRSFLNDQFDLESRIQNEEPKRAHLTLKTEDSYSHSYKEKQKSEFDFTNDTPETRQENLEIRNEAVKEADRKLSYEKHSLTRKRSRKSANYYYRVNDHMELFKVGSSYLRDYQSGIRSMGFSSYNLQSEGEKTIFGISSFFNYHDDLNICIITNHMKGSFYASMMDDLEVRSDVYTDENVEYELFHADGNDFISYEEMIHIDHQSNHTGSEDFIDFLMEKYDLILWDLPSLEYMNKSREVFFPIVRSLESLTLIVGAEVSKGKEIDALISYYQKYQVPIKGVLFSDSKARSNKKKNKKLNKKKKEVRNGLT